MPFLVVNYGAEMVFILEQRLHAQNVKNDKSGKVLQDVTKSMFAPQFVQELMRPQEIYTVSATREIFDRLAQSSIMKLSSNSMDKLYDLMTMGCKYQIISCRHPLELVENLYHTLGRLRIHHLQVLHRLVMLQLMGGEHLRHFAHVRLLQRLLPFQPLGSSTWWWLKRGCIKPPGAERDDLKSSSAGGQALQH